MEHAGVVRPAECACTSDGAGRRARSWTRPREWHRSGPRGRPVGCGCRACCERARDRGRKQWAGGWREVMARCQQSLLLWVAAAKERRRYQTTWAVRTLREALGEDRDIDHLDCPHQEHPSSCLDEKMVNIEQPTQRADHAVSRTPYRLILPTSWTSEGLSVPRHLSGKRYGIDASPPAWLQLRLSSVR